MAPNKSKRTWLILGIAGATLALCLIASCVLLGVTGQALFNSLKSYSLTVGSTAPDFRLTSLDGKSIHLSQFAGQPVLLSFGATWCPHCNANDPFLQQAHEDHSDLVVLLVDGGESRETVQAWQESSGYTFPVLLDTLDLVDRRYGVTSIPVTYFIDEDRVIQLIMVGEFTQITLEYNLPLIGIEP